MYAVLKGNKPDFHNSKNAKEAVEFYNNMLESLKKNYHPDKIQEGVFQAYMNVQIINDGPVTIEVEYKDNQNKPKK